MDDRELLASIGLTSEEADTRAAEYEADAWSREALGRPRRGRPSLADEEVRPFTVRFPVSLMAYVDRRAEACGSTRSEMLRRIVAEARARDRSAG